MTASIFQEHHLCYLHLSLSKSTVLLIFQNRILIKIALQTLYSFKMFPWPYHNSGTQTVASHCGPLGLVSLDFTWDSWWTEWHWRMFLSGFHQFSPTNYLFFIASLCITTSWGVRQHIFTPSIV
jgi:hypothetical protein